CAVASKPVKSTRKAGVSEVDSARRYRNGDRLCRFEEDQLSLESLRGEIVLCAGDKDRRRGRCFEDADLDVLSPRGGGGDRKTCKEKQQSHSITYPNFISGPALPDHKVARFPRLCSDCTHRARRSLSIQRPYAGYAASIPQLDRRTEAAKYCRTNGRHFTTWGGSPNQALRCRMFRTERKKE